jgi:hypothetical protein
VTTHIHINRLVLDNVDGPGDYPAVFAESFTTALRDGVRAGAHGATPPTIGPDPLGSARSAAAAAAQAIRSRLGPAADGDTRRADGAQR